MSYYEYQTTQRYVQFEDALLEIRRYTQGLGSRFLVLTACGPSTDDVVAKIQKSFDSPLASVMNDRLAEENFKYAAYRRAAQNAPEAEKPAVFFLDCEKKAMSVDVSRELATFIKENNIDVVVGVGGGRGMDFARAVTHWVKLSAVVLVPTSASTNASVSQMCVVYNNDGTIHDFWFMPQPPALVLADTKVIAGAPAFMLRAGIGDSISTLYEAQNVLDYQQRRPYYSELTLDCIESSIQILRKYGAKALADAEKHEISREYECVLSQILHYCGPIRAVTGTGFSHILDEALLHFAPCRKIMHGLIVGYGVIAMKVFGGESLEEIHSYIDYCREIGLPTSFAEIGVPDLRREELIEACGLAMDGPTVKTSPLQLSAETIADAAFRAEEIVQAYQK